MPPEAKKILGKFDYEMVHSEVYLNKYVVSIAPFSTPACPDCSQNTGWPEKTSIDIFEDVCSLHTFFSADSFNLLCCITPCESSGHFLGHPAIFRMAPFLMTLDDSNCRNCFRFLLSVRGQLFRKYATDLRPCNFQDW